MNQKDNTLKAFAKALRGKRKALNMTPAQLAEKANLPMKAIYQFENALRMPNISAVTKLLRSIHGEKK